MSDIEVWLEKHISNDWYCYVKRLSGNDTQLTGGHQAGPYIPKKIIFDLFPSLQLSGKLNPRVDFQVVVDSHNTPEHSVNAIWYNNKVVDGGTSVMSTVECRIKSG